jgi:type I restriction enzyme M protein
MNRSPSAESLVRKLWRYCNVLRDDGLSYPDYVEQLTYLLFLKMAEEQQDAEVPDGFGWASFVELEAQDLQAQYRRVLERLGSEGGTLGLIFGEARDKITDPAKLRYLVVELVGQTEWTGMSADVKGDAYEGLLEKNARDTKSGAGQYFTPRPLVDALVECIDPKPGETICDPACGTAGFLLAAHDHVERQIGPEDAPAREHLRLKALRGMELVHEVARLAAMNLYLHGVNGRTDDDVPIMTADSLSEVPRSQFDVVLSNPPFGVKGSITYSGDARGERAISRPDFWAKTSNKQLNFVQHIVSLLKLGARAAVVLPDNVLFEGGAASAVRRRLVEDHDLHTVLRLPPGLFYAHGVLANVLFFDAGRSQNASDAVWVYDFRSDNRFSLKTRPLHRSDLDEFVRLYRPANVSGRRTDDQNTRWRAFDRASLLEDPRCRLDLSWTNDDAPVPPGLERVDELALQVAEDLQRALAHFSRVQSTDA